MALLKNDILDVSLLRLYVTMLDHIVTVFDENDTYCNKVLGDVQEALGYGRYEIVQGQSGSLTKAEVAKLHLEMTKLLASRTELVENTINGYKNVSEIDRAKYYRCPPLECMEVFKSNNDYSEYLNKFVTTQYGFSKPFVTKDAVEKLISKKCTEREIEEVKFATTEEKVNEDKFTEVIDDDEPTALANSYYHDNEPSLEDEYSINRMQCIWNILKLSVKDASDLIKKIENDENEKINYRAIAKVGYPLYSMLDNMILNHM